jgi:hypothetical protein
MINLVVTCAKRKRLPIDPALRLRAVLPESSIEERAAAWLARLRDHGGAKLAAADLYVGEQWSIVREITRTNPSVRLWICSAGYGLVAAETALGGYSATFSTDHPDAIRQTGVSLADAQGAWWTALARSSTAHPFARPVTLAGIAETFPDEHLVVAASPVYLRALRNDLLEAGARLTEPDMLAVVSGGIDGEFLGRMDVRFDARLTRSLGGSMMSLNVRVVREALRGGWALHRSAFQSRLDALSADVPEFSYPRRVRLSDEEVLDYIRRRLDGDRPSQSALLRHLRTELGFACEQKRFRRLYAQANAVAALESGGTP